MFDQSISELTFALFLYYPKHANEVNVKINFTFSNNLSYQKIEFHPVQRKPKSNTNKHLK